MRKARWRICRKPHGQNGFCCGTCPTSQPRWFFWVLLPERVQGRRTRSCKQTWMPLSPPSQPFRPRVRRRLVPTDAALHPSPWGYLDWGRCRSPFHRLLPAVGITAPKGCATRPKPYLMLRYQTALITLLLLQPSVCAHRLPPPPTNMPSLLHLSPQIL